MDELQKIENMISYFNIFKETAANNMGLMHGFSKWTNKMSYRIEGDDLLIIIPPVLIRNGDKISRSRRKAEIDAFMKKKNYTYIEYVIKMATEKYVREKGKYISNMQKRGKAEDK